MPARTRKIRHDSETRAKIQASQLINRLTGHVLGKVEMTPSQVSAGLGLLRKVVPDLSAVEHSGEQVFNHVVRMPAKVKDIDQWANQYGPPKTSAL